MRVLAPLFIAFYPAVSCTLHVIRWIKSCEYLGWIVKHIQNKADKMASEMQFPAQSNVSGDDATSKNTKRSRCEELEYEIDAIKRMQQSGAEELERLSKRQRNLQYMLLPSWKRRQKELEEELQQVQAQHKDCSHEQCWLAGFCDDPDDQALLREWLALDAFEERLLDDFAKKHGMKKLLDESNRWHGYVIKLNAFPHPGGDLLDKPLAELEEQFPELNCCVWRATYETVIRIFFHRSFPYSLNNDNVQRLLKRIKDKAKSRPPVMAATP